MMLYAYYIGSRIYLSSLPVHYGLRIFSNLPPS